MSNLKYSEIFEYIGQDGKIPWFITIKPEYAYRLDLLRQYIPNKGIRCWLVICESPTGYKHLHGMIIYKDQKQKDALRRYINRHIGYQTQIRVDNTLNVYNYITDQSHNKFVDHILSK